MSTPTKHQSAPRAATVYAALLVGLAGVAGLTSSGCGSPSGAEPGDTDTSAPLYVVSTRVSTADGESVGYLASVPALDGGHFDLSTAIETTVGSVYADRERGYLYHASSREPIITRWHLRSDGSLEDVLDLPCPALEVASQDEQGNTYFSPWTYGPTLSLFGEGPALCIRRVTSDSTLDEAWSPDLTTWTQGRPVMVFRYLRDGKAIGSVLHVDEVSGDFSSGYDEALALELDSHWRLWLFDLNAETATPIAGITGATGSGFNIATFDARTFIFVPNEDWSRTTVYELDGTGSAEARFEVAGVVNNWLPIR